MISALKATKIGTPLCEFLQPSRRYSSILDFTDSAEEMKIELPFGKLAAKWWGPQDIQPILCLHGWQDNAGTFDRLIPLLPPSMSFLAVDLQGHGQSEHYPPGLQYHLIDIVNTIDMIRRKMGWQKVMLMGHSMGSVGSYNYTGLFGDRVAFVVGIDALKSHIRTHHFGNYLQRNIDKNVQLEFQRSDREPPAYDVDEMIDMWVSGTNGSVTRDCVKYILKRNAVPSKINPGKFYFSRDVRVKFSHYTFVPQETSVEFAKRIKMPYCFIKATGSKYFEDKKFLLEVIDVLKENNPIFEWHMVEGTHHLHLTAPERVAGIITNFLNKYR